MLRVGVARSLAPRLLLPSAPSLPLPTGGARTLAKKARKRRKVVEPPFLKARERLLEELTSVPVALPELGALHISHGARGIGHTGARKFVAQLLAPLKYQNPDARFTAERDYDTAKSIVRVEVAAGGEQTVDVTGVRQDDILAQVMRAAGATEEAAEAARAAAAVRMEAYFKPGHVSLARRADGVETGQLPESGVVESS